MAERLNAPDLKSGPPLITHCFTWNYLSAKRDEHGTTGHETGHAATALERNQHMSGELLPCTFCGEPPKEYRDDYGNAHIGCANAKCFSQPNIYPGKHRRADAVAAWNTINVAFKYGIST